MCNVEKMVDLIIIIVFLMQQWGVKEWWSKANISNNTIAHGNKHTDVLHVLRSLCCITIKHIDSRKTTVIQFAPSKSLRLFNSSGQLLLQSAGGYLHSPHTTLIQTYTISSVMNQGAACMAAQWPFSAVRDWVVQLVDTAQHSHGPCCTLSPAMFLKDADFRSLWV